MAPWRLRRSPPRATFYLLYHTPCGDNCSYQHGIVAPRMSRRAVRAGVVRGGRGRSQIVDRWQPRVSDQEEGRKEQPDHDGRDERSVEGVESAPVTRGNPWRDRWRRRHAGRSIRSGLTGGCPVPRGILAARSSHAPSPSHPCTTLPVPAAMRAPPSRAPICPARLARVPHHATIIPYPTRAVHPLGDARQRPPPSGAKTPTDAGPRSPDRLHDVTRRGQ